MQFRRTYHMPEMEWRQIAADYRDGYPVGMVANMHLCCSSTIRLVLERQRIQIRSRREARVIAIEKGRCGEPGYLPSREEIERTTELIQDVGYTDHKGVYHPPWTKADRERRQVLADRVPATIQECSAPRLNGRKLLHGDD